MNIAEEMKFEDSFNTCQKSIHANAVEKGFWPEGVRISLVDTAKEVVLRLALIHTEVSEAVEEMRKVLVVEDRYDAVGEELADIVIRTMDLAEALNINLAGHITKKMMVNRQRAHRHNKRF